MSSNIKWEHVYRVRRKNKKLIVEYVNNQFYKMEFATVEECDAQCEAFIAETKEQLYCIHIEGYGDLEYNG